MATDILTAKANERAVRTAEEAYTNRARGGVIIFNARGEVLILKDALNGKWSFPKGAAEPCDCACIMKTAEREMREETGLLRGRDYQFVPERFMNHLNATYFIVEAKAGAEERIVRAPEVAEVAWIMPERCPLPLKDLNAGVRQFLSGKW